MKKTKKAKKIIEITAPVSEIFFSYQGEGLYVGQPQIFIRFAGCNLKCSYCDTPKNRKVSSGKQLTVKQIIKKVTKLARKHRIFGRGKFPLVVSITGGEPLLHSEFLKKLLPALRKLNYWAYLETNGTLPEELKKVSKLFDVVSMDIKLSSACKHNYWEEHARFLSIVKRKVFVKLILTNKTDSKEVFKAVHVVWDVSHKIPFVLQPVTQTNKCKSIEPHKLFVLTELTKKRFKNVNVIPQMHKFWKIK